MILRVQHCLSRGYILRSAEDYNFRLNINKEPAGRPRTLPNQEILTTSKTWGLISPSSNTICVKLKTLIFV